MIVTFLGTNGWYSTKTGNTPCILIDTPDSYLVLDAGDGINKLDGYVTEDKPVYLFLSHFHLDHICGLHVLNKFNFRQGMGIYGQTGTRDFLNTIICRPYTVPFHELRNEVRINELEEGEHTEPERFTCLFLQHRDPCIGFRFELGGKVITYATDTGICENDAILSRDADVLIHECSLKSGQHSADWPHTNPIDAAELAKRCNVKKLILTHFDASIYRSMDDRKKAGIDAKTVFKNTVCARDGLQISI